MDLNFDNHMQTASPITWRPSWRPPRRAASATPAMIRNRRLAYLRRTLRGTDYFSREAVQLRNPLLYRSFFPDAEVPQTSSNRSDYSSNGVVASLFDCMDHEAGQRALEEAITAEEECDSESDEEEADEEVEQMDTDGNAPPNGHVEQDEDRGAWFGRPEVFDPHVPEKERMRELQRLMEERWLDGLDADFDYASVDQDPANNDENQVLRDAEDAWFSAESDEAGADEQPCTDTGILDY
ncbi:Coiled-coil domain-containing protein 97 [Blastocladiella emersonii ATCC 22665]|nr:Coiled-coil domain-containing protein 97 [Blastocladiella emersonii ATCC 22665]